MWRRGAAGICFLGGRVSARATAVEEAFVKATHKETQARAISKNAEQQKRCLNYS